MPQKRKFEVHGVDKNGDLWIVATESSETAEHLKRQLEGDGHSDVKIIENP